MSRREWVHGAHWVRGICAVSLVLSLTTGVACAHTGVKLPAWFSMKKTQKDAASRSETSLMSQDFDALPSFKGSKVAIGYVSNTGNTQSQNINLGGVLNYTRHRWNWNFLSTYERQQDRSLGVTENKLYSQGRVQYALNLKDYVYSQISYLSNRLDGYVYVYNENMGYGRYFIMPPDMTFDVFVGPGLRQRQLVASSGGGFMNEVSLQLGSSFVWDFSKTANLTTSVQTETARDNTHTEASIGVTSFLVSHLAMNVSFLFGDDSQPVEGKEAINTTTTVQLLYSF
jgi:putative salt-induced outer membrane protein